jgi:hypothetical protein
MGLVQEPRLYTQRISEPQSTETAVTPWRPYPCKGEHTGAPEPHNLSKLSQRRVYMRNELEHHEKHVVVSLTRNQHGDFALDLVLRAVSPVQIRNYRFHHSRVHTAACLLEIRVPYSFPRLPFNVSAFQAPSMAEFTVSNRPVLIEED